MNTEQIYQPQCNLGAGKEEVSKDWKERTQKEVKKEGMLLISS
jgi:hypothetical protein